MTRPKRLRCHRCAQSTRWHYHRITGSGPKYLLCRDCHIASWRLKVIWLVPQDTGYDGLFSPIAYF